MAWKPISDKDVVLTSTVFAARNFRQWKLINTVIHPLEFFFAPRGDPGNFFPAFLGGRARRGRGGAKGAGLRRGARTGGSATGTGPGDGAQSVSKKKWFEGGPIEPERVP